LDKLSHHDLAHVAEHHEINVHKKGGGLIAHEDILKSVKEAANCQPQYFEFFACLDKCVSFYFYCSFQFVFISVFIFIYFILFYFFLLIN